MKAVIMAGGEGTRLRPLTCGIPKPMVPILNKPVMEYTINLLKRYGIKDIAVTLAYYPAVITDYFGNGEEWGVNLNYFIEEAPLGTGGSVLNAEEFLDDTFIIVSGDALTDFDVIKAIDFHREKKSKATLVLKKAAIPLEYGVIIMNDDGQLNRFLEKPSWGEVFSDTINTGIYVLEPEVLKYYKKGDVFDFSKDLFPKLLKDQVPMYGYVTDSYWNDIGDLKVYKEVNFDLLTGKVDVPIHNKKLGDGVWVGSHTYIDDDCLLAPPVYIGDNCIIKKGARLSQVIVGDNCEIAENTSLKQSIIWNNSVINSHVEGRGTVICSGVGVKKGVHLYENTVIGKGTILSENTIIKPDIKIWPDKMIEADAVISQNLIWGTKAAKTLFGYKDISGYINIDLSPEFCSKLGAALGSILKEGSQAIISTDHSGAANLIKESLISGILSTGTKVTDIEKASMPINRFAVRFYKAESGIHVRQDNREPNKVHIEFVSRDGINIDRNTERKIENLFAREDFKRCNSDQIKSIIRVDNFCEFYIQNGANILKDLVHIKSQKPKILLAAQSENILLLASAYLENIGCQVILDYELSSEKRIDEADRYLNRLSESVIRKGASIGALLSEDGENVILVDHKGRIIDREKYLALVSLIILKKGTDSKLVVPNTASRIIEKMAKPYKIEVLRTKNTSSEILSAMVPQKSDQQDLMLQYLLNFDAIWGTGCLIDFLVSNSISLSDMIDELPDFHVEKTAVKCDWKHKGRVIREIIEENKNKDIELFEGVRINSDKGWVLVLPDSEKPVCNVYVEGISTEFSKELSDIYSKKIGSIIKKAELESSK